MKLIKITLDVVMASTLLVWQEMKTKQCFLSSPEDSISFGETLAVNQDYLAVGDPQNNRVVIYNQQNNSWKRTQVLTPPANSAIEKVGFGFGNKLP